MRLSTLRVLALSFLFSAPAFADSFRFDGIFNGTPVAPGGQTWRSTVALTFNGFACTGVFIARDLIVTAAHCDIVNDKNLNIALRNGNALDATELTFAPGEFKAIPHPGYIPLSNPTPGIEDLQVVVLNRQALPAAFTPTSLLPQNLSLLTDVGGSVTIVGAGGNGMGAFSDRLYFADGLISNYFETNVMEVKLSADRGICGGDSGGPVFTKSGSTLYLSAIINARADDIALECGKILYAARIGASEANWILSAAGQARLGF